MRRKKKDELAATLLMMGFENDRTYRDDFYIYDRHRVVMSVFFYRVGLLPFYTASALACSVHPSTGEIGRGKHYLNSRRFKTVMDFVKVHRYRLR